MTWVVQKLKNDAILDCGQTIVKNLNPFLGKYSEQLLRNKTFCAVNSLWVVVQKPKNDAILDCGQTVEKISTFFALNTSGKYSEQLLWTKVFCAANSYGGVVQKLKNDAILDCSQTVETNCTFFALNTCGNDSEQLLRNEIFCAANSLGGVRWSRSPSWILGLWFGFFKYFLFASSLDRASAHFLSEKFFYATNRLGAIYQNNSSYIDI